MTSGPPLPLPSRRIPLARETDVAIVGGGIMGLALAHQLAMRGVTDVVVMEAGYLAGGASGRNGGGVRQQWGTPLHIRLMQESLQICQSFAQDVGTNIWMRQGGYLFLAKTDRQRNRMEKNVAVQNQCGVKTRLITPHEAQKIVPGLNVTDVLAACYNPTDAIVFPWPFLWGYAHAAAAQGVAIHTFTPVRGIDPAGDGFILDTPKGRLRARRVINAGGAWSPAIARMVGVHLPTWPSRHEILSTEALKPFLRPMVSVLDSGLYFSQSMRGEIVAGITYGEDKPPVTPNDDAPPVRMGSRLGFVQALATAMVGILPVLGRVKMVRQWAGPYDMSPDGGPIVGEAPGVPNFFLCCGFVGHGFMMAPVVARHYAIHLTGGPSHEIFTRWRLGRFIDGDTETEDLNIG